MLIKPVIGHEEQINRFLKARSSGRFHHAWLFEGPKGIGKATTARNLAASLLGSSTGVDQQGRFFVRHDGVVDKLIAGSHPDFRYLEKEEATGAKAKQDIPVSALRQLTSFFELKPALGGYRVAIIDALDELNPSGANALLKTLEEPPAQCVLILIYHKQSGLLPTIRSRCQKLTFEPLKEREVRAVLSETETAGDVTDELLKLAAGSPGIAQAYQELDSAHLISTLNEVFRTAWPQPTSIQLNRLLQIMAVSETHLDLTLHFIDHWLAELGQQDLKPALLRLSGRVWQDIHIDAGRGSGLKLDLTERSAQCLNRIQMMAREFEALNAV